MAPQLVTRKSDFFRVWKKFVERGVSDNAPENIRNSWLRSRNAGLNPLDICLTKTLIGPALQNELNSSIDFNHLLAAHHLDFEKHYAELPLAVFFTNPDGDILSIQGNDLILKSLDVSPLGIGSSMSEALSGTSALAISLMEKQPAIVTGEEHYFQGFHWASCFATPIFSEDGSVQGVLDFSTLCKFGEKLKQIIPSLMRIANSLQFEIYVKDKLEQIKFHEAYFESTFDYAKSMLIMTDTEGRILNINVAAQSHLKLNIAMVKKQYVSKIFGLTTPVNEMTKQTARVSCFQAGTRAPLIMETIPIFDIFGREKAYLIKITKTAAISKPVTSIHQNDIDPFGRLIGKSKLFQNLVNRAAQSASSSSSILLEGETGTGKELLAHAIHQASRYANGPFIAINCSAIPNDLVESELFGYDNGAFTGACRHGQIGKFELASGGTLFLDEIHTMTLPTQMKLLRVLEERKLTRVGAKQPIELHFRVIAATSKHLPDEIDRGHFLAALFYRLNVVNLRLPNLNERKDDIPYLVSDFINQMNSKFDKQILGVSPDVEQLFESYSWPGNVRELKNAIESASIFCTTSRIIVEDLEGACILEFRQPVKGKGSDQTIETVTKQMIDEALDRFGNAKAAAEHLGIPKSTFYRRLKTLGENNSFVVKTVGRLK